MIDAPEHAELSEHVNAYVDAQLDPALRDRVAAHLQVCPICRLDEQQLRMTRRVLRALPELRAPRPFTIEAPTTAAAPTGRAGALPWLAWAWRLGSLGAAACIVLAGVAAARPLPSSMNATSAESRGVPSAPLADKSASQRAAPQDTPAAAAPQAPALAAARQQGTGANESRGGTPTPGPIVTPQPFERPPLPRPVAGTGGIDYRVLWSSLAGALALMSAIAFAVDRRSGGRRA